MKRLLSLAAMPFLSLFWVIFVELLVWWIRGQSFKEVSP